MRLVCLHVPSGFDFKRLGTLVAVEGHRFPFVIEFTLEVLVQFWRVKWIRYFLIIAQLVKHWLFFHFLVGEESTTLKVAIFAVDGL